MHTIRIKVMKEIIQAGSKIAALIDESTIVSNLPTLITYVRNII